MGLGPSETGRRVLHGTPLSAINGSESVRCIVRARATRTLPINNVAPPPTGHTDTRQEAVIFVVFLYYYDILGITYVIFFSYRPLGPFFLFVFSPRVNAVHHGIFLYFLYHSCTSVFSSSSQNILLLLLLLF